MADIPDFATITELAGDPASREQIQRLYRRYYWAGRYARGRDVLEVACGAGQGLGYLASLARSVSAGDVSDRVLHGTRAHYGARIDLRQFDAHELPFPDASFDVLLLFEAIYYLRNVSRFVEEARRVLRPGGHLLIVSANKDLYDFTPSPFSIAYYGVVELHSLLAASGFETTFLGDTPVAAVSLRQRVLRPVKLAMTRLHLMPTSKRMKAVLKRAVFGPISSLPAEIGADGDAGPALVPIPADVPDTKHKVLFCEARRGP